MEEEMAEKGNGAAGSPMQEEMSVISMEVKNDLGHLGELFAVEDIHLNEKVETIFKKAYALVISPITTHVFYGEVRPADLGFERDPLVHDFFDPALLARFNRRPFDIIEGFHAVFKIPSKSGYAAHIGVLPVQISEELYGLLSVFEPRGVGGKFLSTIPIDKMNLSHYRISRTSRFLLPYIEPPKSVIKCLGS